MYAVVMWPNGFRGQFVCGNLISSFATRNQKMISNRIKLISNRIKLISNRIKLISNTLL